MIAGPHGSGAGSESERAANLRALNRAALEVFRKGHIPTIGVNLALPIIGAAPSDLHDEIMTPISLALAERCGAVPRIGGASPGRTKKSS